MIRKTRSTGFIRRLLRDTSANTLALTAAAVIPLIGVVGGGVDTGRIFLAKSRLQQACDSATLAARKQLGATELDESGIPSELHETADNFFQTNFADGSFGTTNTSYELSHEEGTRMDGDASTRVPTTLMAVFGYDNVQVDVDCSADLNLPNIDVVLVLDMSGSMNTDTDGVRRVDALKDAVYAFYDEIMAVKPANARVRMGLVPYNASINVGKLLNDLNPAYISDSPFYQSREAVFEDVLVDEGDPGGERLVSDRREPVTREKSWLGSNTSFDYSWSSNPDHPSYGRAACDAYDGTYMVDGDRWVISNDDYDRNYYPGRHPSATGGCEARVRKYRTFEERPPRYERRFKNYIYKEMDQDTSIFKLYDYEEGRFTRAGAPSGLEGATEYSRWNGCIREVETVNERDFDPLPANAYDLNIDHIPSADKATQWVPQWPEVSFDRGRKAQVTTDYDLDNRSVICPQPVHKLQEYPLQGGSRNPVFSNRIDSLVARGNTLHDIGIIWGGRLISPDGIYAADNASAGNGEPIVRHVIFMTDGLSFPNPGRMNVYGNYDMDERFAGAAPDGTWSRGQLEPIHQARFRAVCESVKKKNITIWTVTLELPRDPSMISCATGESRALDSESADELAANFRKIATSIAELRLVK